MKKKSQIRKYSVQKVAELTQSQTIPEMLKLYAQHVEEKKIKLQEKRNQLAKQLAQIRKFSQKIVFQMVDGVKDRLQKSEKIVMGAQSRPSNQDIKYLTQLFTYMQNQKSLIHRNSQQSSKLHKIINQFLQSTSRTSQDYSHLDEQFQRLQKQCEKQEKVRDQLLKERDGNRSFYQSINRCIAECRVKYDIVQAMIAQRQKHLDHLTGYYNTRQRQDLQKIQIQVQTGNYLQSELLKAQAIINANSERNIELGIRENQYDSRKMEQNNQ